MKMMLEDAKRSSNHPISLNIGRNIGNQVDALSNQQIESAIKSRFPGATIASHDVIPAQPNSKFGPFEPTSRVTLHTAPTNLKEATHGLSADLNQDAIPALNHATNEAVLAGPKAHDWGGQFDKNYFVHEGDATSFGNRQADYQKKFTTGYYHGSPSPNIKEFNPLANEVSDFKDWISVPDKKVTFATRDTDFADSFLGTNRNGYDTGSTMYPVSINLGKHFDAATPEGHAVIKDFAAKQHPDNPAAQALTQRNLKTGSWDHLENPAFLQHLEDTGHDTFAVHEGGIPNVGVFNPANIRGKFAAFNPDNAASTDFMKKEGGAVKGYAKGGNVARALEHAVPIQFTHFSPKQNLTVLDPTKYGTGMKGAEAGRLANAPDIAPRSYFYHGDNIVPESGVGGNKFTGTSLNSYPWTKDPANFYTQAKTNDPYLAQMGVQQHSPELTRNNMERMIKDAGYSGYHTDTGTGVLFNDTPVTKAQ
jgi:hypothetical protein